MSDKTAYLLAPYLKTVASRAARPVGRVIEGAKDLSRAADIRAPGLASAVGTLATKLPGAVNNFQVGLHHVQPYAADILAKMSSVKVHAFLDELQKIAKRMP